MRTIIVLVGITLVLAPTAAADAGDSTDDRLDFGFTDDGHSVTGEWVMDAESAASGSSVSVTPNAIWAARQASEVSFTIADGTEAIVHVTFTELTLVQNVTVEVGKADSSGNFVSAGSDSLSGDLLETGMTETFEITLAEQTINEGEYPAINVSANLLDAAGSSAAARVDASQSYVHYQDVPPPTAYPTPELSTLLLSGMGILGMIGVARVQRDGTHR